jgi:hypothetical protein
MYITQKLIKDPNTKVIIVEDFPKWCMQFDQIPYLLVNDKDVVETKNAPCLNDTFITHIKDYTVTRGTEITDLLENNKDCIFTMNISDIERCAFFIYSVVQYFYRKEYNRMIHNIKSTEKVVFVIEEAQNIFDSSVISKKIFNRLKKIFSVARNMDLHFLMCTQRMQDLNTKIRGRMRLLLGQVSLDDYELKVGKLVRHSKYKEKLLSFPRGTFLYTSTDTLILFPEYQSVGKPYLWSNKQPETLTIIEQKLGEILNENTIR